MLKLNVKTYNITQLKIARPVKIPNGFNLKTLYNSQDFQVQTPLCKITEINLDNDKPYLKIKFTISNNFQHFQFFFGLNQLIIENLEKHSKTNLAIMKKVNENIEGNFSSSINKIDDEEIEILIRVNKETLYFNKTKDQIHNSELKVGNKVVALIFNKGIFVDNYNANLRWTATQILKFQ